MTRAEALRQLAASIVRHQPDIRYTLSLIAISGNKRLADAVAAELKQAPPEVVRLRLDPGMWLRGRVR